MKKQPFPFLLSVTLLFAGFLLGFLFGRNTVSEPVMVSVPRSMQTAPVYTESTEPEIVFPIDLNRASREEILALPGIGDTLTLRIMAYREARGRFFSLDDLLNVEGITVKILDQIRDLVYIGG